MAYLRWRLARMHPLDVHAMLDQTKWASKNWISSWPNPVGDHFKSFPVTTVKTALQKGVQNRLSHVQCNSL